MSSIENVYFQNNDEDFKKKIYPFFVNLKNYQNINKSDQIYFNEIKNYINVNNRLPFDFNSQELFYFKKNDKSKWIEYFLFRYKFRKFPKEKIVSDFPIYVLIEPVSTCNIRCVLCFQIDKSFTRKPYMGTMNMDFFKKIIDDCYANGT